MVILHLKTNRKRRFAMGTYFNPPHLLPKVARKLESGSYPELVEQLLPGEELFGHYDRFVFQNAAHLHSESEYNQFEDQVKKRIIIRLGFYAMPKEQFEKI